MKTEGVTCPVCGNQVPVPAPEKPASKEPKEKSAPTK
jgi:rRNA maturation protein Nop10